MQPLESAAPLIIYIDFKSPYAYLAIEPTRNLLAELGVVADWRPFVLNIGSYLGTAKLAKTGEVKEQKRSAEQWSGVKYAYFDCRRYANLRALTVRGTVKIWNTDLPAIGMFWLKQQESLVEQCQPDSLLARYIDAVYVPFWKRELDVEQLDVVEAILEDIGAEVTGFREYATGLGQTFNTEFQQATFAAGVYGVPTYLVQTPEGQSTHRYFGREHLPRIAWHLSGERGPAPDVEYESGAVQADAGVSELTVCVDFKSPGAYLALAPTIDMAQELGIHVDWQIVQVPALREPKNPGAQADRGALHKYIRGRYVADDLQRYAPHPLHDLFDSHRSDAAAIGLLWVRQHQADCDGYVQAVFARYWQQQQGIDDLDDIEAVLKELQLSVAGFRDFAAADGADRAAANLEELRAKGVTTSPTYLLGEEPFQGRQHLPLLRARLQAAQQN
ncbi:MAG: DsbA family protein [Pseudomonadota bacterium]|nr:DsbA family protein [Pseudomonadota bacterium]MEC7420251.1 DsbA family protein [Pseudomonadota bacterium]MEC7612608.1 DsbA family protein [Pseudomonadota bacterium]MEC7956416.1 DsbA family protein [Pseudomonadota bacterium]MEC7976270.1 DsbA family protein [Pseudomonadota bacterium]